MHCLSCTCHACGNPDVHDKCMTGSARQAESLCVLSDITEFGEMELVHIKSSRYHNIIIKLTLEWAYSTTLSSNHNNTRNNNNNDDFP